MPTPLPDDSLLLIRCSSCGQRFKVGLDLKGRTVECGGCLHRFKIGDDVIVRGKKFYPGERVDPVVNRFQRVPIAESETRAGMMKAARYATAPDPAVMEPVSPQRIIAGILGAAGMVLMGLILMLANGAGGLLDGMVTLNRLLLGGFTCVIGTLMLLYANPRARLKTLLFSGLLSACVLAVPFFFQAHSTLVPEQRQPVAGSNSQSPVSDLAANNVARDAAKSLEELKERIGIDPLVIENNRLMAAGSDKHAHGIWFRNLAMGNRYMVGDYIVRVAGADPMGTHFYPRGNGGYLLVVTGISQTLEALAELIKPLGSVDQLYPEISVIECQVNMEIFVEGASEKLNNPKDPAFYDLNKRELESIDLSRVEQAVQKLAVAEPKLYRPDISRKLTALLGQDAVKFKPILCEALMVWADKPGPAGEMALTVAEKMMARREPMLPQIIALAVKEKNPKILPILAELWVASPGTWETACGDAGGVFEPYVIKNFPALVGIARYSAVRLLGRVGGNDSLILIANISAAGDPEMKVLLEQARKSIQDRLGK